MKRLLSIVLVLSGMLNAQDYINLQLNSGYKHELISNLKEITFNGDNVNFELNSGAIDIESMNDIIYIAFGAEPLGDQSLPVEFSYFNATRNNGKVYLNWETASEVNNLGFDVERRHSNNPEWEKIDFVQGKGSSSMPTTYSYTDENIAALSSLKYRLKQIDYDGTYEYSEEISVTVEEITLPLQFRLHDNYPNPFNPSTTITYQIQNEAITTLKIFDVSGREISTLVNENQKPGIYDVNFNGNGLASGVYFCQITSGSNIRMIKMILMK